MENKSKHIKIAIVISASGVGKTTTIMKRIAEILSYGEENNECFTGDFKCPK